MCCAQDKGGEVNQCTTALTLRSVCSVILLQVLPHTSYNEMFIVTLVPADMAFFLHKSVAVACFSIVI
jgi:hypothetical protein